MYKVGRYSKGKRPAGGLGTPAAALLPSIPLPTVADPAAAAACEAALPTGGAANLFGNCPSASVAAAACAGLALPAAPTQTPLPAAALAVAALKAGSCAAAMATAATAAAAPLLAPPAAAASAPSAPAGCSALSQSHTRPSASVRDRLAPWPGVRFAVCRPDSCSSSWMRRTCGWKERAASVNVACVKASITGKGEASRHVAAAMQRPHGGNTFEHV